MKKKNLKNIGNQTIDENTMELFG